MATVRPHGEHQQRALTIGGELPALRVVQGAADAVQSTGLVGSAALIHGVRLVEAPEREVDLVDEVTRRDRASDIHAPTLW